MHNDILPYSVTPSRPLPEGLARCDVCNFPRGLSARITSEATPFVSLSPHKTSNVLKCAPKADMQTELPSVMLSCMHSPTQSSSSTIPPLSINISSPVLSERTTTESLLLHSLPRSPSQLCEWSHATDMNAAMSPSIANATSTKNSAKSPSIQNATTTENIPVIPEIPLLPTVSSVYAMTTPGPSEYQPVHMFITHATTDLVTSCHTSCIAPDQISAISPAHPAHHDALLLSSLPPTAILPPVCDDMKVLVSPFSSATNMKLTESHMQLTDSQTDVQLSVPCGTYNIVISHPTRTLSPTPAHHPAIP